jgi:hypothetical protein
MALRSVVFIAERRESDGTAGTILTGVFDAHHEVGDAMVAEAEGLTAGEAIAWGREHADEVLIRLGEGGYHSAGTVNPHGAPAWTHDGPIAPRRLAGDEWRDRSERDPPVPWLVILDLWASLPASEADAEAFAERAAARLGALHPVPAPDSQDLDGMTLLLSDGDNAGPGPWQGSSYRIELELAAPTARMAMVEAVRRCAAPDGWAVSAYARPRD